MNKIVDVVKWSFKFSNEYVAKSVKVQHTKYDFEQTLTKYFWLQNENKVILQPRKKK